MTDKIKTISKEGVCVVCLGETNNNTMFIKCKHILNICDECICVTNKKCHVCSITTDIITGCFVI